MPGQCIASSKINKLQLQTISLTVKLGLGTAAIGRPQYINIRTSRDLPDSLNEFRKMGLNTLEYAYDRGIRYFDTAPGYGMAEQLLSDWLNGRNDNSIQVATKWGYTYVANFDPNAKVHEVKEHSLNKLNEQWQYSSSHLKYISALQIHSATFESGVLENDDVLKRLAEIKFENDLLIGLTSSGENQKEVLEFANEIVIDGKPLFDLYQVTFNMLDQSVLDVDFRNGTKIVVKEALANGRVFRNCRYPHYQELYDALDLLASKYGVGVDAIAIRYCLDRLNPFVVLSGASNPEHIDMNLKALEFRLTTQELTQLDNFRQSPEDYWNERKKLEWN